VLNPAAAAAAAAVVVADFQYNTRPDSNYGPGRFHDGFVRVADQLWDNGMKEALDAAVAAGDVRNIIISGHSLGAATASLLASRAQVMARREPGHEPYAGYLKPWGTSLRAFATCLSTHIHRQCTG
jgi:hypothetical protein